MAEKVGLEFEVKGVDAAIASVERYNKAISKTGKAQEDFAGKTSKFNLGGFSFNLDGLKSVFGDLQQKILNTNPAIASMVGQLGTLTGAAGMALPAIAGLGVALVAGTAAFAGFMKLGVKGASLQPTITAFGNLASQYGDSTDMLKTLRTQTKGTVTDMELMRLGTFALGGASKELGTVLSKDLGTVLYNTRKLAVALGQDPVASQSRFIEAIKKGERELLDEYGLIVSADKAYTNYAKSINKASTALTDQEKSTAFAMETITQLNQRVKDMDVDTSVIDNLRMPMVVFQNMMDKVALAIQPAFEPVAQLIADIALGFGNLNNLALPLIETFATILGTVFTGAVNIAKAAFNFFFGDIVSAATVAIPYVIASILLLRDVINGIASIASTVASTIGAAFSGVAGMVSTALSPISGIASKIFGDMGNGVNSSLSQTAVSIVAGGTKIVASFASGLLQGASMVTIAVTKIAQIVADFLQGFSPPKEGPLKDIDKGGQNVATAWVDGFTKNLLQPVDKVAADIELALGDIGKMSKGQVATRLADLDKALIPFQDRLEIVKGSFEQMAGFADPAIKTLEKQLGKALESKDVKQATFLDQQLQSLYEIKGAEQERLDQAELQLALAKSQQAQERALLQVQEKRAVAVNQINQAMAGSGGGGGGAAEKSPTSAAEKAAKGGDGAAEAAGESAGGLTGGAAPNILSNESIDNAKAAISNVLSTGVAQGVAESGFNDALSGFQADTGALMEQVNRIKEANPAAKIADKFKQLPTLLGQTFTQAKEAAIEGLMGIAEAIPFNPMSLISKFTGIVSGIGNKFTEAKQAAITAISTLSDEIVFNPETLLAKFSEVPSLIGGQFVAAKEQAVNAISGIIPAFQEQLSTLPTMLGLLVTAPLMSVFTGIFGEESPIQAVLMQLLGEEGVLTTALTGLTTSITEWTTAITPLFDMVVSAIERIPSAFSALPTAINGILSRVLGVLRSFATGGLGLDSLAGTLNSKLVGVFATAANAAISALEGAINSVISPFLGIPGVGNALRDLGLPVEFPEVPARAKGGLGVKGWNVVGEKGAELVNFSRPANIFPAGLSRSIMDGLGGGTQRFSVPDRQAMQSTVYNNQKSISSTFNVNNAQDAMLIEQQRLSYLGIS